MPEKILAPWRWRTFAKADGIIADLRDSYVDRDGNKWVGSDLGALKYDGYEWSTLPMADQDSMGIRAITQTSDGAMWFSGSVRERGVGFHPHIWRYDPGVDEKEEASRKRWTEWPLGGVEAYFAQLLEASDGTFWRGDGFSRGPGGIYQFDSADESWRLVDLPIEPKRPKVVRIGETSDGSIWFTTRHSGVIRYGSSPETGEVGWSRIGNVGRRKLTFTTTLQESEDGLIYIGSYAPRGIVSIHPRSLVARMFTKRDGLPSRSHGTMNGPGGIWALGMEGPDGAISRLDAATGRWSTYTTRQIPGLPNGLIFGGMENERLWIQTGGGGRIALVDMSDRGWLTYGIPDSVIDGRSSDGSLWFASRKAVYQFDGSTWMRHGQEHGVPRPVQRISVTADGSVWCLGGARPAWVVSRYREGRWERHTSEGVGLDEVTSLGREFVVQTEDGTVYLAGSRKGKAALAVYDGGSWDVHSGEEGMTGRMLSHPLAASDGTLWFSIVEQINPGFENQEEGVLRYVPEGNRWSFFDGLTAGDTHDIAEVRDGEVWVCTQRGQARFTGKGFEKRSAGDTQPTSLVAFQGDLWWSFVGPLEEGLATDKYGGERARVIRQADGIAHNRVHGLRVFDEAALWAMTTGGVSRFDGERWINYTKEHGLPDNDIRQVLKSDDGRIWFVTADGSVSSYEPDLEGPRSRIVEGIDEVPSLGNILIRWAGYDKWKRTRPEDMQYQYRLAMSTDEMGDWSETGKRTDFTYTGLRPGAYRFEVRAIDDDGNVDPNPAVHAFVVLPPWWQNPWVVSVAAVLLAGFSVQTTRVVRRDRRLIEANQALSDANNELFGLNESLQLANQEISAQSERKSAFLASMSHELRTPMNAIKGFTNLVLRRAEGQLDERHAENLRKVDQASDHLLAQINDLLDLSKIEAGRMDVSVSEFDVREAIEYCVSTVSPLVQEGVELSASIDASVGTANTDEQRVRQMVINLLSNAVKFTDAGSVTVEVSIAERGSGGGESGGKGKSEARVQSSGVREGGEASSEYRVASAEFRGKNQNLVISVSDTGKGIPEEEIPTLFDEYRQVAGQSESEVQRGTGLGLSITKRFAELLGGSIEVESVVGEGSTFTVVLPIEYGQVKRSVS